MLKYYQTKGKLFRMKRKIFICLFILLLVFIFTGCEDNQSNIDSNIDNNLEIQVIDKMALSYIQSRQSDAKFIFEDKDLYFVYIKILVKNVNPNGENVSFGSLDSDYYAKLDIGKAVDETVYFQDNQHLNDRIPYWCPLGDEESWEKIVFSTSLEDLTIIKSNESREWFLAFVASKNNVDYDLNLKIYKNQFFKDEIVGEIKVGKIQITE